LIRFIAHTEIDKVKWDECVNLSDTPSLYCNSWVLDVISPGWHALVEGDYEKVMPLTHKKKYGIYYLFQPYFCQQAGVFVQKSTYEKINARDFIYNIPEKYKYIDIALNKQCVLAKTDKIKIAERKNIELDISHNYKILSVNYSENTKRNIKKAVKNKVDIKVTAEGENEIISQFRKNQADKKNIKNEYIITFKKLAEKLKERKAIKIYKAYSNSGKMIAGAVFAIHEKRVYYLFSSVSDAGRLTGASHLIIDEFIKKHAGTNVKILDFEGSDNINLARFYNSFGSRETVYLRIIKNELPVLVKWLKK
jgi:lipid II:glycine glycyltransferase (peptidoglycan interpeptide bridge formation enzyme)